MDGQVRAAHVAPAVLTRLRLALPVAGWCELAAGDWTVALDLG